LVEQCFYALRDEKSTNASRIKRSRFKKGRCGARQFAALLRALGQIPADQEKSVARSGNTGSGIVPSPQVT
jgi:hypothetical protein